MQPPCSMHIFNQQAQIRHNSNIWRWNRHGLQRTIWGCWCFVAIGRVGVFCGIVCLILGLEAMAGLAKFSGKTIAYQKLGLTTWVRKEVWWSMHHTWRANSFCIATSESEMIREKQRGDNLKWYNSLFEQFVFHDQWNPLEKRPSLLQLEKKPGRWVKWLVDRLRTVNRGGFLLT